MTFGFTGGAYNHASGTRDAFRSLSDALVAEGHPPMVSVSGDREFADEVAIFTSRYRQQATGNGPYNDVRFWNGAPHGHPGGTRWVRVSGLGTVAVPGTSNHGKRRSNDLAWPYNTDTAAAARAKRLAEARNITREGENFGELWHWTFWGSLGVIGQTAGGSNSPEEDDMPYTEAQLKKIIHDTVVSVLRADEFRKNRNIEIAEAVHVRKVSDDTGTLAETTRDARVIARRAEDKVERLAAGLGVDLTG